MQAVMHSVRMSTKMDLNNDFVLRGTPLPPQDTKTRSVGTQSKFSTGRPLLCLSV